MSWIRWMARVLAVTAVAVVCGRLPSAAEDISPPGRLRDPFQPIGYSPPAVAPKEPPPTLPVSGAPMIPPPELWEEARKMLRVGGFTAIGSRRRALINDRVVGEGDRVEVEHQGFLFRWIVDKVDQQGVDLRPVVETSPPAAGETPAPYRKDAAPENDGAPPPKGADT